MQACTSIEYLLKKKGLQKVIEHKGGEKGASNRYAEAEKEEDEDAEMPEATEPKEAQEKEKKSRSPRRVQNEQHWEAIDQTEMRNHGLPQIQDLSESFS